MDRVFEAGAAGSAPAAPAVPSTGFATGGNPGGGVPATKPGPYWFHMITEELRAVLVAAGLTPDHTNLGQIAQAISALVATAGVAPYSGTQALALADVRKQVLFSGATGNATFTLPALSSVSLGAPIAIKHATSGAFVLTVQRAGADTILTGGSSITSFTMLVGDSVVLVKTAGGWLVVDGTVELSYATGAPLLGVNQTWQAVTRTAGTTYTNTTGKPILLLFNANSNSATVGVDIVVGGGPSMRFVNGAAGTGPVVAAGCVVIPPGATYVTTETNVAARNVFELR